MIPQTFAMDNYPNPFNATTQINFEILQDGNVTLDIYNIGGQMVENLVDNYLNSGSHSVTFDGSNLPSGVYFYKLTIDENSITRKMVLLK